MMLEPNDTIRSLFSLLFCCLVLTGFGQSALIPSKVFDWVDIKDQETAVLGTSDGFSSLNIAVVTLPKGESKVISEKDHETLIIMKEGSLKQRIKKEEVDLGVGSVTVLHAGNKLKIENSGSDESVFYLMKWRAKNTASFDPADYPPVVWVDWDTVKYQETKKGGRRRILRQPTPMLEEFEMHVTTLNEGIASHPPHTHLDEEIILVRFGKVEELIDGKPYEADAGSFIFLRSMVPHGIRNIGEGQCEYYAFRWIPREI